jgi:hypothetical protein
MESSALTTERQARVAIACAQADRPCTGNQALKRVLGRQCHGFVNWGIVKKLSQWHRKKKGESIMPNATQQLGAVKRELLDIFMDLEVADHESRKQNAAVRYLRARRGIEMHNEIKRLERDIADFDDLMQ